MLPIFAHSASTTAVDQYLSLSTSRDVTYSCGSCGYELNLSSCNRNTTNIDSKYTKVIKKGVISFFTIDESRFSQRDVVSYRPYFLSRSSWGLIRRRTKLFCRKCGSYVGNAVDEIEPPGGSQKYDYISGTGTGSKVYSIRIGALRPSAESVTLVDI